jgi:hypothetical protein
VAGLDFNSKILQKCLEIVVGIAALTSCNKQDENYGIPVHANVTPTMSGMHSCKHYHISTFKGYEGLQQ